MKKYFLLFFVCTFLFAENAKIIRTCRVYDKASKDAKLACTLKAGAPVTVVTQVEGKISEIASENCKGFLYSSCVSLDEEEKKKALTASAQAFKPTSAFKVGFLVEGEGPLAQITGSTQLSKGLGFGIGAIGQYRLFHGVYLVALPSYRFQKLSRTIDGSGSLRDPSAGSYSQSVWNVALQLAASVNILELVNKREQVVPWTVKLGGEFLLPTSAMQTDASGTETSFTATKMVNLILGSAIDFTLTEKMSFRLGGDVFYHLTARDSTSLYGIRVGGAGIFDL